MLEKSLTNWPQYCIISKGIIHKVQFTGYCMFHTCSFSSPRLGISCISLYDTYSVSVPSGSSGIWSSPFSWHTIVFRLWRHWQVGGQILDAHTKRLKEDRVKAASIVGYLKSHMEYGGIETVWYCNIFKCSLVLANKGSEREFSKLGIIELKLLKIYITTL